VLLNILFSQSTSASAISIENRVHYTLQQLHKDYPFNIMRVIIQDTSGKTHLITERYDDNASIDLIHPGTLTVPLVAAIAYDEFDMTPADIIRYDKHHFRIEEIVAHANRSAAAILLSRMDPDLLHNAFVTIGLGDNDVYFKYFKQLQKPILRAIIAKGTNILIPPQKLFEIYTTLLETGKKADGTLLFHPRTIKWIRKETREYISNKKHYWIAGVPLSGYMWIDDSPFLRSTKEAILFIRIQIDTDRSMMIGIFAKMPNNISRKDREFALYAYFNEIWGEMMNVVESR
jgi:hypothetical protein